MSSEAFCVESRAEPIVGKSYCCIISVLLQCSGIASATIRKYIYKCTPRMYCTVLCTTDCRAFIVKYWMGNNIAHGHCSKDDPDQSSLFRSRITSLFFSLLLVFFTVLLVYLLVYFLVYLFYMGLKPFKKIEFNLYKIKILHLDFIIKYNWILIWL